MHRFTIIVLTFLVLTACNNSKGKISSTKNGKFMTEPNINLKEKSEAEKILKTNSCIFLNPDTSLSKITLRDSKSAKSIISIKDKIENEEYHYYSTTYQEMLTMIQHPGDSKYQISILRVEYSDKTDYDYRKLNIDTFKTEKGIKLGMSKNQIIEKLGSCYVAKDSSEDYIQLYYRLETPNDSKTRILENNYMPIYYASYKLRNDRLKNFEFGFEYP